MFGLFREIREVRSTVLEDEHEGSVHEISLKRFGTFRVRSSGFGIFGVGSLCPVTCGEMVPFYLSCCLSRPFKGFPKSLLYIDFQLLCACELGSRILDSILDLGLSRILVSILDLGLSRIRVLLF